MTSNKDTHLDKKLKLSIVIPVYNEIDTIDEIIANVKNVRLHNITKEIILVNDCSIDGTKERLEQYVNDPEIIICHHH